jgi:hypothetical protein
MMPADDGLRPDDMLTWALRYATCGLRVVPIKPGGKHPNINAWQKAATTDPEIIGSWWTQLYRDHGIGIAMGNGLFALDVDVANGKPGAASLADLEAEHGPLPATVEARTGSGGRHLIYASDAAIRNNANTRLGAGLDIRGDGGQIVVAPTIHPTSGLPYTWLPGRAPWETHPALAPDWLVGLLVDEPKPATPPAPAPSILDGSDDSIAEWVNRRTNWQTLLTDDGWQYSHSRGDDSHWTRPGKQVKDGTSAVLHEPDGPFVIFSTDHSLAPLMRLDALTSNGQYAYSAFGYIAATRHNGDRSACARAARYEQRTIDSPVPLPPQPVPKVTIVDEPQPDKVSSWQPLDLAHILSGDYRPTAPDLLERSDGQHLFYMGKINSLFGESGSGKTWVALLACAQAIWAGNGAVFIDLEDSPASVAERMMLLGVTRDELYSRFAYVRPSDPSAHGVVDELAHIETTIAALGATLVVIDSLGEAMSLDAVKPNEDDAVAYWHLRVARRLAHLGPAVVLLDHIVKSRDAPELFAIGSQRKRAAIDGHAIRVDLLEPFSRDKGGRLKLTSAKDRHGMFSRGQVVGEMTFAVGANGLDSHLVSPVGRDAAGTVFRPTALMERISRWLEDHHGAWSQNEIEKNVSGKGAAKRTALQVLVDDGYVTQEDAHRGHQYRFEHPYRESNDTPDTGLPTPETATASHRVPPRPTASRDAVHTPENDRVPRVPDPRKTGTRDAVVSEEQTPNSPDRVPDENLPLIEMI